MQKPQACQNPLLLPLAQSYRSMRALRLHITAAAAAGTAQSCQRRQQLWHRSLV
jgi:hypothetical protein